MASSVINHVDLSHTNSTAQPALLLLAQVCIGLLNSQRPESSDWTTIIKDELSSFPTTSYYADLSLAYSSHSSDWLERITDGTDVSITPYSVNDLLYDCSASSTLNGYIKYSYESQKLVVPNLVTLAGALDAVLIDVSDDSDEIAKMRADLPLIFDATEEWSGFDAHDATSYIFENHMDKMTGLVKSNPGFDEKSGNPFDPPLTTYMDAGLVDFIVSKKMFNFFLTQGCIPGTKDHELMKDIAAWEGFETPTAVWGYDNTFSTGAGSKFEAETDCVSSLGQVASKGVPNLSWFSLADPIEDVGTLVQQPTEPITFDPTKVYISFLIGDGDNFRFVIERHQNWWQTRKDICTNEENWAAYNVTEENACFPLVWSISPQTLRTSPGIIEWYYDQAQITGNDFFVLPPSGELYSYPGGFSEDDQASYKESMQRTAKLMNISGTVHWEFPLFSTWNNALPYFEQYAQDEDPVVNGFHCVNVPYFEPILEIFGLADKKVLNDKVVLFKSKEWRGVNDLPNAMSPTNYAKEINSYEPGAVKSIYITSDGGLTFTDIYELVGKLDMDKIVIVNQEQLVEMALAAENR